MNDTALREALRGYGIDANRVHCGLWMGAKPPAGDAVALCGFHALVLCAEEHQRDAYTRMLVLKCPLDDATLSPKEHLLATTVASKVALLVNRGGRVLVTCREGRNRSGLVTSITLHFLTGWPGVRCADHVRKKRSGADALTNESFLKAIEAMQ